MAHGLRQPPEGVIAHNDMGSQYTSIAYAERLIELGLRPSIGSRGDAYDRLHEELGDIPPAEFEILHNVSQEALVLA